MVWVYEDSKFSTNERKLYDFLRKKRTDKLAEKTVKFLKLMKYLYAQNFNNWKEVHESAFYDSKKTKPVFSEKVSKHVFHKLRKLRGGGPDDPQPVVEDDPSAQSMDPDADHLARKVISGIQSYDPTPISSVANNVYGTVTGTVKSFKETVPFFEYILHSIQKLIRIGNVTLMTGSEIAFGAFGAAGAQVVEAFTGLFGIMSALAEDDMGKAIDLGLNSTPLGPTYMAWKQKGGKRFSTKRNNKAKCPKTTRRKLIR